MDDIYMELAYKEAVKAYKKGEMPVGAVIVCNNKVLSRGHNRKETSSNSTMHAEMIAINNACKKLGDWRLNECLIYVTMEPCLMCLGAIIESRIPKIIYGIKNKKCNEINKKIIEKNNIEVVDGILKNKIQTITTTFFNDIRNR